MVSFSTKENQLKLLPPKLHCNLRGTAPTVHSLFIDLTLLICLFSCETNAYDGLRLLLHLTIYKSWSHSKLRKTNIIARC